MKSCIQFLLFILFFQYLLKFQSNNNVSKYNENIHDCFYCTNLLLNFSLTLGAIFGIILNYLCFYLFYYFFGKTQFLLTLKNMLTYFGHSIIWI